MAVSHETTAWVCMHWHAPPGRVKIMLWSAILSTMRCSRALLDVRNGILGCELPLEVILMTFWCKKIVISWYFQWKFITHPHPTQSHKLIKIAFYETKEQRWALLDARNRIPGLCLPLKDIQRWYLTQNLSHGSPAGFCRHAVPACRHAVGAGKYIPKWDFGTCRVLMEV